MSGYKIMPSYGLMIEKNEKNNPIKKVYITGDTQYCPYQIRDFYEQADVILEDCETFKIKSHVHAHYEDLILLEEKFKSKMWLYHYDGKYTEERNQKAIDDGFKGFLKQGQILEI
jgi:ribonuclease BN (tRNA processing enzyme)